MLEKNKTTYTSDAVVSTEHDDLLENYGYKKDDNKYNVLFDRIQILEANLKELHEELIGYKQDMLKNHLEKITDLKVVVKGIEKELKENERYSALKLDKEERNNINTRLARIEEYIERGK
jgi:hypothetical protein